MIVELLEMHDAAGFPEDCRGRRAGGIDLVRLDADVVDLASRFLASGSLGDGQRLVLDGCASDAERLVPLLAGDARSYFSRVHELATEVLRAGDEDLPR